MDFASVKGSLVDIKFFTACRIIMACQYLRQSWGQTQLSSFIIGGGEYALPRPGAR